VQAQPSTKLAMRYSNPWLTVLQVTFAHLPATVPTLSNFLLPKKQVALVDSRTGRIYFRKAHQGRDSYSRKQSSFFERYQARKPKNLHFSGCCTYFRTR